MPLVPASAAIPDHIRRLRRKAAYHKRELQAHRRDLQQTMHTLAALEADCQQRGIVIDDFVTDDLHQPAGEGVFHGPDRAHS